MFKKSSSFVISTILFLVMASPTSTSASTNPKIDLSNTNTEVLDVTNDNNYMVSKGQVILSDLDVLISDVNHMTIKSKSKTIDSNSSKTIDVINEELKSSSAFRDLLLSKIESGANLSSIGYSEVTLKENSFGDSIPITKSEYWESSNKSLHRGIISGEETSKGKLRLFTMAETMNYNGEKYVVAYTQSRWLGWDTSNIQGKDGPAMSEDYMSITVPTRYTLFDKEFWNEFPPSSGLTGLTTNWCTNDTAHALVYAFDEVKAINSKYNTYASTIQINARGKSSDTSIKFEKFTSHYIHSYKEVTISPSVTSTGEVSFGVSSSDKSWQLSSAVTDNF